MTWNCAHIANATISIRNSGAQDDSLRYLLSDVTVASLSQSVDQTDATEQVSLAFGKIEIEYRAIGSDGKAGAPVRSGFDLRSNKAVMSGPAPGDGQLSDASTSGV